MRIKKILMLSAIAFLLGACSEPNETICLNCGAPLWTAQSQKVVITQKSGNALNPTVTLFEYDRAMLAANAAAYLVTLKETEFALSCVNDGIQYEVVITDSAGLQKTYLSSNSACGSTGSAKFVATAEMKKLFEFFLYGCQGKTVCSEMTSCSEATFYLNNCPNTTIDGNNDGVPCESQWCGR